jgi:uncharacterized membrane protein YkoI
MFRKWIVPMVLSLGLAGVVVFAADSEKDDDQSMNLSDAPQAVQDGIHKALGDHQLTKLSKEDEDGKAEYEAEYQGDGGMNDSVSVGADGSVVETEQQIDPTKLPDEIVKAVKNARPDSKITKAELSSENGKSVYEVKISEEVVVGQDGTIQKDED